MWVPLLRKRRQRSQDEDDEWPPASLERGVGGGASGSSSRLQLPSLSALADAKAERIARFKQQTSKSYTVTFSPRVVMATYLCIALLFIPIGSAILAGSHDISSTPQVSYNCALNTTCRVTMTVERLITPPSYLYYVVDNMHQNLKIYVKSRSDKQLRGVTPKKLSDVWNCDPYLYKPPYHNRTAEMAQQMPFEPTEIINPCGLTANSTFSDKYKLMVRNTSEQVPLNHSGIAWPTDKKYKFIKGKGPYFTEEINRKYLTNEHFMVWMRLSAFSRVEKLYARILVPLKPGDYVMEVDAEFEVDAFRGRKSFYISNVKWFGARNHFLGVLLVTTGAFSLVVALVILAVHVMNPRKPAHFDPDTIRRELAKLTLENAHSN